MEENFTKLLEIADLRQDTDLDQDTIRQATVQMLRAFGEDPERAGLERTPERVAGELSLLCVDHP